MLRLNFTPELEIPPVLFNSNTTNVKVKRSAYSHCIKSQEDSNTTNVKVKLTTKVRQKHDKSNSNTTNVKVKHPSCISVLLAKIIQIQPMLRLN